MFTSKSWLSHPQKYLFQSLPESDHFDEVVNSFVSSTDRFTLPSRVSHSSHGETGQSLKPSLFITTHHTHWDLASPLNSKIRLCANSSLLKMRSALQLYVWEEIFLLPFLNLDLQVTVLRLKKIEKERGNVDYLGGAPGGVNYSTSQIVVSNWQLHTPNSVVSKKSFCLQIQRSFCKSFGYKLVWRVFILEGRIWWTRRVRSQAND